MALNNNEFNINFLFIGELVDMTCIWKFKIITLLQVAGMH